MNLGVSIIGHLSLSLSLCLCKAQLGFDKSLALHQGRDTVSQESTHQQTEWNVLTSVVYLSVGYVDSLLLFSPQFSRFAVAGHTHVPVYSSKWRLAVQVISVLSPSIQLQKTLQTVSSGCAKKPFLRGHSSLPWGSSVNQNIGTYNIKTEVISSRVRFFQMSQSLIFTITLFRNHTKKTLIQQ